MSRLIRAISENGGVLFCAVVPQISSVKPSASIRRRGDLGSSGAAAYSRVDDGCNAQERGGFSDAAYPKAAVRRVPFWQFRTGRAMYAVM